MSQHSEIAQAFNALRESRKEKKKSNTEWSTNRLKELGIQFESKNGGVHLIVRHNNFVCDFWPSTGLFQIRKGKGGRGINRMLKELRGEI